jgi:hypothetical protein
LQTIHSVVKEIKQAERKHELHHQEKESEVGIGTMNEAKYPLMSLLIAKRTDLERIRSRLEE